MMTVLIFYLIVSVLILVLEITLFFKRKKIGDTLAFARIDRKPHWVLWLIIAVLWFPILVGFVIFAIVK